MKKICILLCCVLLLQFFTACKGKNEEFDVPVNFYYCNHDIFYNSPSGVIQAEVREGSNFNDDLTAFLYAYLRGPISSELQSFIPSDVYLVACSLQGDVAEITLSSSFSRLSGVRLSMVCSAILMSVHDFAGVQTLRVQAKDAQLDDKDEFIITFDELVLIDTARIEE